MKNKKRTQKQYIQKANRKYKDRLFRMAFKDKKDLLDLYNAINDTDYQNPDDLQVNTLEDVLYLSFKNDMSFLIAGTMNLYEHQSSYNLNMPIRGLLYFAKLYEKYIKANNIDIYSSSLKRLPIPRYFVFYNGTEKEADETKLRLSTAFQDGNATISPCLECVATLLNINYGHNQKLMEKCRRLEEYSIFVHRVREFVKVESNLDTAVNNAVDSCIKDEILKDILVHQRSEVISMVLNMTWEEHLKLMRKEQVVEVQIFTIISQIQKKCKKGKSPEVIADEVEESVEFTRKLYDLIQEHPDWSEEEIYRIASRTYDFISHKRR